jgi:hypothetical protein
MQKIKTQRNMHFVIFSFDPGQLVNYIIAPFIHAVVANIHLRVQNPEKAESFGGKIFHLNIYNLLVTHCAVV